VPIRFDCPSCGRHLSFKLAIFGTLFCVALITGASVFAISRKQSEPIAEKTQPDSAPSREAETDKASSGDAAISLSAEALYKKASPAVVRIDARDSEFNLISGSGFVVSEDGLIATNYTSSKAPSPRWLYSGMARSIGSRA
jgi:hypothetical protein